MTIRGENEPETNSGALTGGHTYYTERFPSEICNLIFNRGESCGNLRWDIEDLLLQGQWHYTAFGKMSGGDGPGPDEGVLYLFSPDNPGRYYADIECALWGQRKLAGGQSHIILNTTPA